MKRSNDDRFLIFGWTINLIDINVLTWLLVILQTSLMCTSRWRSRMLKAQQSRCEETSPAGNRTSCCEYCCFWLVFPCFWTNLHLMHVLLLKDFKNTQNCFAVQNGRLCLWAHQTGCADMLYTVCTRKHYSL